MKTKEILGIVSILLANSFLMKLLVPFFGNSIPGQTGVIDFGRLQSFHSTLKSNHSSLSSVGISPFIAFAFYTIKMGSSVLDPKRTKRNALGASTVLKFAPAHDARAAGIRPARTSTLKILKPRASFSENA